MMIKDVTPILELTYEQAMAQMLTHRRKSGRKIEVNDNPCLNHDDPIIAGRCKLMGCYYDLEEPDYD